MISTGRQLRGWTAAAALALAGSVAWIIANPWPAHAPQEDRPRLFSTGPIGLTRGQTSRHIFHRHDDLRDIVASVNVVFMDMKGNDLVNTTVPLPAEGSLVVDLAVL